MAETVNGDVRADSSNKNSEKISKDFRDTRIVEAQNLCAKFIDKHQDKEQIKQFIQAVELAATMFSQRNSRRDVFGLLAFLNNKTSGDYSDRISTISLNVQMPTLLTCVRELEILSDAVLDENLNKTKAEPSQWADIGKNLDGFVSDEIPKITTAIKDALTKFREKGLGQNNYYLKNMARTARINEIVEKYKIDNTVALQIVQQGIADEDISQFLESKKQVDTISSILDIPVKAAKKHQEKLCKFAQSFNMSLTDYLQLAKSEFNKDSSAQYVIDFIIKHEQQKAREAEELAKKELATSTEGLAAVTTDTKAKKSSKDAEQSKLGEDDKGAA